MTTFVPGAIALLIALGYLGLLAWRVPALPLVIVLLIGFVAMVASFIQEVRAEREGG